MKGMMKNNRLLPVVVAVMMIAGSCSKDAMLERGDAPGQNALKESAVFGAENQSLANPSLQNKILADIRKATAKYHDIEVAFEDEYAVASPCVMNGDGTAGMGFHVVHFGLLGGGFEHTQPQALLYEPTEDGGMRLVGVEYVIIADAWNAIHGADNPPFLGVKEFDFVAAAPPDSHGLPFDNYQLHVWVWRNNPDGMYTPYNPKVSCQFAEAQPEV